MFDLLKDVPLLPAIHHHVDITWAPILQTHAVLIVAPASESLLRLLWMRNPEFNIGHVLYFAVQRGIPFHLGVPYSSLHLFNTQRTTPRPPEYFVDYVDQSLICYVSQPSTFCAQWLKSVAEVMQRCHARAYIHRGGILSRIAREFGPSNIVALIGMGPSEACTRYGRYSEPDLELQLVTEVLPPSEVSIVIGQTVPRVSQTEVCTELSFMWPPPWVIELSPAWKGEWDNILEAWFLHRSNLIRHGFASPKSEEQWKNVFNLPLFPGGLSVSPSVAKIQNALQILRGSDGISTWNKRRPTDLTRDIL